MTEQEELILRMTRLRITPQLEIRPSPGNRDPVGDVLDQNPSYKNLI